MLLVPIQLSMIPDRCSINAGNRCYPKHMHSASTCCELCAMCNERVLASGFLVPCRSSNRGLGARGVACGRCEERIPGPFRNELIARVCDCVKSKHKRATAGLQAYAGNRNLTLCTSLWLASLSAWLVAHISLVGEFESYVRCAHLCGW